MKESETPVLFFILPLELRPFFCYPLVHSTVGGIEQEVRFPVRDTPTNRKETGLLYTIVVSCLLKTAARPWCGVGVAAADTERRSVKVTALERKLKAEKGMKGVFEGKAYRLEEDRGDA